MINKTQNVRYKNDYDDKWVISLSSMNCFVHPPINGCLHTHTIYSVYTPSPNPAPLSSEGDAAKKLIILNMRLDGIWWKGGDKKANVENGWKA